MNALDRYGQRMLITLMLTIIAWGAWSCMGPAVDASCKGPRCLASQWTPAARLRAAQAIAGEAGLDHIRHSYRDSSTLPHVWVKRWKQRLRAEPDVTLEQVIERYAKPLHASRSRAKQLREMPWGPLDGPLSKHNADWIAILVHVGRVARGEVSDPCPRAMHYWGPMDAQPESFERVCRWVRARNRLGRRRV